MMKLGDLAAPPAKKKAAAKKLDSVNIEFAENGMVARCNYSGGEMGYHTSTKVFKTPKEAGEFIASLPMKGGSHNSHTDY